MEATATREKFPYTVTPEWVESKVEELRVLPREFTREGFDLVSLVLLLAVEDGMCEDSELCMTICAVAEDSLFSTPF